MSDKKLLASVFITAIVVTGLILFSAVVAARSYDDLGDDAKARSLYQVNVIRLESNSCSAGIISGLGERGFSVTTRPETVDAILEVDVKKNGRNLDEVPNFGGFGNKASYTAVMRGQDGKILFATSGSEGSINMAELCGDIGDTLGDQLNAQRG